MKKRVIIAELGILIGLFLFNSCAAKMDRQALVDLMENYIAAVVEHDPSAMPLAENVKLVENT
ncbi:MAG: hypothetical protein PHN44_12045, partial [Candidatus Marinimicrobia bacterium]|nr:hypothetical protein [Candidatus Neomarinimicrobiota bacterium]